MREEYIKKSEIEDKIDEAYEDLDGYDPDSLGVFYDRLNEIIYGVPAYTMPEVASSGEYISKAEMEKILYSTNDAVRIGELLEELPTYSIPETAKAVLVYDKDLNGYTMPLYEAKKVFIGVLQKEIPSSVVVGTPLFHACSSAIALIHNVKKIRREIEESKKPENVPYELEYWDYIKALDKALDIIDKYIGGE